MDHSMGAKADDRPGAGIKRLWQVRSVQQTRMQTFADFVEGAAIKVMKGLGKPDNDPNTWLLGITVGIPFFAGAVLGLLMTDPITGIMGFGRRGAICAAGVFSFMSVIGSASVNKWEHLLGFRILLGAGMAGKASIVPILLSETSPKNIRGMLLVFWQLFVAFGLAAGSVANLSVYQTNPDSSWRYMFIAAFIPALLLLSLILFSPGKLYYIIIHHMLKGD
jgi:MFS family permease